MLIMKMVSEQYYDNFISYMSGHTLTTLVIYNYMSQLDWLTPIIKITLAFAIGFVGGIGGLVAKDVYRWFKGKENSE